MTLMHVHIKFKTKTKTKWTNKKPPNSNLFLLGSWSNTGAHVETYQPDADTKAPT